MPALDVALATAAHLPDGDPDERRLLPALEARGVLAAFVPWEDAAFDWRSVRLVVIRSTWGYYKDLKGFLKWVDKTSRKTRLCNPAGAVAWNARKIYLIDLEARGVPVVPTAWVARRSRTDLRALAGKRGWTTVVVKPVVGAGSHEVHRVEAADPEGQAALDALTARGEAMVQPWLPAAAAGGERAMVFLDGQYSHAVAKRAPFDLSPTSASAPALASAPASVTATGTGPGTGTAGEPASPDPLDALDTCLPAAVPTPAELEVARKTFAAISGGLLYARVDTIPAPDGAPLLSELELIEPRLFLGAGPGSAERLADAIARLLAQPHDRR